MGPELSRQLAADRRADLHRQATAHHLAHDARRPRLPLLARAGWWLIRLSAQLSKR